MIVKIETCTRSKLNSVPSECATSVSLARAPLFLPLKKTNENLCLDAGRTRHSQTGNPSVQRESSFSVSVLSSRVSWFTHFFRRECACGRTDLRLRGVTRESQASIRSAGSLCEAHRTNTFVRCGPRRRVTTSSEHEDHPVHPQSPHVSQASR